MNTSKIIKAIKKRAIEITQLHLGYVVKTSEFKKLHYCWKYQDAIEWMACYSHDTKVAVFQSGNVVAMRR